MPIASTSPTAPDEWVTTFAAASTGDDPAPTAEMLLASIKPPPPPVLESDHDSPRRHRSASTRDRPGQGLLLLWFCFLLGSWLMTLRHGPSLGAARWMILAAATGLMAVWPAVRLSQSLRNESADASSHADAEDPQRRGRLSPARVALMVLTDWFWLMAALQLVVWSLPFTTRWSARQTLVLDLALAAWSLLSGALVALGCMSDRGLVRTLGMIGCLAILLVEPALMALVNLASDQGAGLSWTMRVSPLEILWMCSDASSSWVMTPWLEPLTGGMAAAVAAWAIVLYVAARRA